MRVFHDKERRGRRIAAAAAVTCAVVIGAAQGGPTPGPVPICQLIPNGSFDNGFEGWSARKSHGGYGTFSTSESLSLGSGCDNTTGCMSIFASAEWMCEHPSGSGAQSQVSITHKASVTGRYLRFQYNGFFFGTIFDDGEGRYVLQAVVTDEEGNMAKCPVAAFDFGDTDLGCDAGIAFDGFFPCTTHCCDVIGTVSDPTGITIGETVTVSFVWSAAVNADDECDYSDFGGEVCINDVQFCKACDTPTPTAKPVIKSTPISP